MVEVTMRVELKRRSLLGTLRRLPRTYRQHYSVFRRSNGRIVSLYGAWLMASLILKFQSQRREP